MQITLHLTSNDTKQSILFHLHYTISRELQDGLNYFIYHFLFLIGFNYLLPDSIRYPCIFRMIGQSFYLHFKLHKHIHTYMLRVLKCSGNLRDCL